MKVLNQSSLLRLCLAGALVAALPLAVPQFVRAQDAQDTTPYTWQFNYKKGDVSRYRVTGSLSGQLPNDSGDLSIVLKSVMKEEVKNTTDVGEADLGNTMESMEISVNGQPFPSNSDNQPTVTMTVNRNGLVLKRSAENNQPGLEQIIALGTLLSNMPVPPMPVKIGDTWKTELDNPLVEGKKVTLTSKLVGKEKVAGIDTLKVRVETSVPTKDGAEAKDTIKAEGVYNVDPQAGRLVRSSYDVTNLDMQAPFGTLKNMSQKLTLIVPGVNDKEETAKP
ncbi:MAG TPA: hypothetical protein VFB38_10255 [Chthonomonadaceae bacterium]|nr:hypothetical protein [Chthonomonadaceae bacterium]